MTSFEFAWTPEQYREYTEASGHTPTQDPPYNHSAGNPGSRGDLSCSSASKGSAGVTPETQRSFYGLSDEQRDALIKRYPAILLSEYATDHFDAQDLRRRIEAVGLEELEV